MKTRSLFLLLLSGCVFFLTACNSQPPKHQTLTPQPLPVFQRESVNISTDIAPGINGISTQEFNQQLSQRLRLYGANQITEDTKVTTGLQIETHIRQENDARTYEMTIYRQNRPLVSESFTAPASSEIAINGFLNQIHLLIANANSFF